MFGCLTNCATGITEMRKAWNYKFCISCIIVAILSPSGEFGSFQICLCVYMHNDDNSLWLAAQVVVLIFMVINWLVVVGWLLTVWQLCLGIHSAGSLSVSTFVYVLSFHLFLIIFCCCLLVSFEILRTTHQMLTLLHVVLQVSCWMWLKHWLSHLNSSWFFSVPVGRL